MKGSIERVIAGARHLSAAFVVLAVFLTMPGCMTPYQARGVTGGYSDQKVNETTYRVSFYGNGKTPKDRVFRFWLYRCADLTAQNGYDYFTILGKDYSTRHGREPDRVAMRGDGFPAEDLVPARGSSGASRAAPSYVYVPGGYGGTITTWSANGYIVMRKGTPEPDDIRSFAAKQVMADLGAEVRETTANATPNRTAAYDPDKVLGGAPSADAEPSPAPSSSRDPIGVDMNDLKSLLPVNTQ